MRRSWTGSRAIHVVVDWSATNPEGRGSALARVELEADSTALASVEPRWTCCQSSDVGWEDALSAAGCEEVVLTAELDDDPAGKHLVLGLAERLTQKLAASHPLIRVRFVPRPRRTSNNRSNTHRQ